MANSTPNWPPRPPGQGPGAPQAGQPPHPNTPHPNAPQAPQAPQQPPHQPYGQPPTAQPFQQQPQQNAQPQHAQPYPAQPYGQAPQAYPQQGQTPPTARPVGNGPTSWPPSPGQPANQATPAGPTAHQPAPGQPSPAPTAQPLPVQDWRPGPIPAGTPQNPAQPQVSSGFAQPGSPSRPTPVSGGASAARPIPAPVKAGPQPIPAPAALPGRIRDDADGEEDPDQEKPPQAVRAAPPWLISLVVHMVLLIVLALITIPALVNQQVDLEIVQYSETEGEQLIDDSLQVFSDEQTDIETPIFSEDLNPVNDPFAALPDVEITHLDGITATDDIDAPSIGLALTGREKGMKKALLAAYGGNATTEQAVLDGLHWLARNQLKDGSWSLSGPYSGGSTIENKTSATAMALLAFQGAGHTHKSGEFKKNVADGWDWLIKQQDKDGNFFHSGPNHHRLYSQAQAMIAICELYGMTKDPKYKEAAQLAVDYAVRTQAPAGGWRYSPGEDSDTSVTGWFVMGLQSGMMAGLEVPSPTLDRVSKYLDKVAEGDGSYYAYQENRAATTPMTAEGLLCRQYLGWKHKDPRLHRGIERVVNEPIDYSDQNVYYWYYATQAAHHMEGEYWEKWNSVMRQAVPEHQIKTGAEKGSWSSASDRWGNHGGRLFTTCLSIYMLEVYYRHLPIYKYRIK